MFALIIIVFLLTFLVFLVEIYARDEERELYDEARCPNCRSVVTPPEEQCTKCGYIMTIHLTSVEKEIH